MRGLNSLRCPAMIYSDEAVEVAMRWGGPPAGAGGGHEREPPSGGGGGGRNEKGEIKGKGGGTGSWEVERTLY